MPDWSLQHELIKSCLSAAAGVPVLALGWLIGQRLTFTWNVRQKRRELQLTASQQFYAAYGEFFAVWKLWNYLDPAQPSFEDHRWELHKRAATAEAIVEGTFVKLSSELDLEEPDIKTLACFRQGFQHLREAIRAGRRIDWHSSDHPEYRSFKALAVRVAGLLSKQWPDVAPVPEQAAKQLLDITSNRWSSQWSS